MDRLTPPDLTTDSPDGSVQRCCSIDDIISTTIAFKTAQTAAKTAAHTAVDTAIHHTVAHRLHVCLTHVYQSLTTKSRVDSAKFASLVQVSIDLTAQLLSPPSSSSSQWPSPFASSLRAGHRNLLNSFLTLIKSSPSFVASALLSMGASDTVAFASRPSDPVEDLGSLGRSQPLDILFHGMFPPGTPQLQVLEYFSSICAILIDNRWAEKVVFSICDLVMSSCDSSADSAHNHAEALELILSDIIQAGGFATMPSADQLFKHNARRSPSTSSSAPTSEVPSPELSHATLSHGGSNANANTQPNSTLDGQFNRFVETSSYSILKYLNSHSASQSIPHAFLVFVRLILAKVSQKTFRHALYLLVVKYFVRRYLCRAITLPESLGLLKSTFINDLQRQRILTPVFNTLSKAVEDAFNSPAAGEGASRRIIDSIFDAFSQPPPESTPSAFELDAKFGPMANYTETEYYSPGQLMVLCPADVVCLYSALFPVYSRGQKSVNLSNFSFSYHERKSPTLPGGSFDESAGALGEDDDDSNLCSPISGPEEDYEWSLESIRKDMEPVIDELVRLFPYLQFRVGGHHHQMYSLRPAKLQYLKLPQPYSEQWQAFRVNDLGEIDDIGPEFILEQAKARKGTLLAQQHQPSNPYLSGNPFDDDGQSVNSISTSIPIAPTNRALVNVIKRAVDKVIMGSWSDLTRTTSIYTLLSDALERSMACHHFLDAMEYSNALSALKKLLPSSSSTASYAQLSSSVNSHIMNALVSEKQTELAKVNYQIEAAEALSRPYQFHLATAKAQCQRANKNLLDFRVKVWYASEIRLSPLWNRAREVAKSLSLGSEGQKEVASKGGVAPEEKGNSGSLRRNRSSSSLPVFSFKRFTSAPSKRDYYNRRHSLINTLVPVTDDMFASKEYAGENKLSDKESDATRKWLRGQNIQNFCTGEERIHRFCCEVDDLVKRIMGDTLTTRRNRGHSALSSSPLFKFDLWKMIIEVEGIDRRSTSSLHRSSIVESDLDFGRDNVGGVARDIPRASSVRAGGGRHNKSSSNLLDMFTSLDLSGSRRGSPVDASPCDSGFESTGTQNHKRGSSSSDKSMFHRRNHSLNEIRTKSPAEGPGDLFTFSEDTHVNIDERRTELDQLILDLRMKVTGMICTDIGLAFWFDGSETDKWITSDLVVKAVERTNEQKRNMRNAIHRNASNQASSFKLSDPPAPGSRRHSRKPSQSSSIYRRTATEDQLGNSNTKSRDSTSGASFDIAGGANNTDGFDYNEAYREVLHHLSVSPSPLEKLHILHSLVMLVVASLSSGSFAGHGGLGGAPLSTPNSMSYSRSNMASVSSEATPIVRSPYKSTTGAAANTTGGTTGGGTRVGSITGARNTTSLSEAIATVEARRCSSGVANGGNPFFRGGNGDPNTDSIAEELRRVFSSPNISSPTLFRDLQFIAAFVPSEVLDLTDYGKAFWDVSLAALSTKDETIGVVVETAAEIFQYQSGMIATDMDHSFLSQWTLKDCAELWSIAAKEGDTVGQRELAIMHMSHPEITPLCLMPFSKLGETFDASMLEDSRLMGDLDKCDPVRMGIVHHWMTMASNHGDNIATEYLMQQQHGYI